MGVASHTTTKFCVDFYVLCVLLQPNANVSKYNFGKLENMLL